MPNFKFDHSNLKVLNLERSLEFYKSALNLHEVSRKVVGDAIFVRLSDEYCSEHQLELKWPANDTECYKIDENKVHHIAFKVNDFKAAHTLHKNLNCICHEILDVGIYFITDPDGYWIEILS